MHLTEKKSEQEQKHRLQNPSHPWEGGAPCPASVLGHCGCSPGLFGISGLRNCLLSL